MVSAEMVGDGMIQILRTRQNAQAQNAQARMPAPLWGRHPCLPFLALFLAACSMNAQTQTYAVIITGPGGEKEFDQQFADISSRLATGLRKAGLAADHIVALPAEHSRKEEVARVFQDLAAKTHGQDTLLVFLVGHGTYDGHDYKFNVTGPDPTAAEFRQWLDKVPAGKQVIVNSSASSGAATEVWSRVGRVVVTATRNGQERNATVFMRFFAEALTDPAADMDKNGIVSALEAYRYAEQHTAKFYESAGRIATEHPMLDDNGDGKGVKDPSPQNGEGLLAATVPLVRLAAASARVDTPEARELRAKKETLENEIASLKYNKASLQEGEYKQQLDNLLLNLARTQQQLEKLESGKP
jgi:hypothetical protein